MNTVRAVTELPPRPRRAVTAVVLLQIGVVTPVFLTSVLAPYLRADIGLDERALGIVVAMFYFISSLSAVPVGRAADRQGWERGLFVSAGALLMVLLAGWLFVSSVPLLAVMLAGAAVAQSLAVGSANLALARLVVYGRQGLAFGVKHAAVPVGMMLAGLLAPQLAESIGWRWAFLLIGVFPATALALLFSRRRSSNVQRSQPPRVDLGRPRQVTHGSAKALRLLAVAAGMGAFTSGALGAFFVLFGVHQGLTPALAGVAVALSSGVNIFFRVCIGWIVDRAGLNPLRVASLLLLGGSTGFLLLAGAADMWMLFAGAVLAYGLGWSWQGLLQLSAIRFWPAAPGRASGVVRTGISAGAGSGPLVAGFLIGASGYLSVWLLLAALSVLAAAGMSWVARASNFETESPVPLEGLS